MELRVRGKSVRVFFWARTSGGACLQLKKRLLLMCSRRAHVALTPLHSERSSKVAPIMCDELDDAVSSPRLGAVRTAAGITF